MAVSTGCLALLALQATQARAEIAPEPQPVERWAELNFDDVLRALDRCGIDTILRETFDLWWLHRLAYKQIAARLQIPASTVGTRVYRVKQQLRSWARAERLFGNIRAEAGHSMSRRVVCRRTALEPGEPLARVA